MKHIAIATSVAMLAFCSQAADLPSGSTNAPAATNAPHFSSKFAERLHQLKERDATNKVPDRVSQQALIEKQKQQLQLQHDEIRKRDGALLPPLPPNPESPVPRYKSGT